MNKQMEWYIKQAIEKYPHPQIIIDDMYSSDEWVRDVMQYPRDFGDALFRALQLAVKDVG